MKHLLTFGFLLLACTVTKAMTLQPGESVVVGNTQVSCGSPGLQPVSNRCCRITSIYGDQELTLWIDGSMQAKLHGWTQNGRLENKQKLIEQAKESGCANIEFAEDHNSTQDGQCTGN